MANLASLAGTGSYLASNSGGVPLLRDREAIPPHHHPQRHERHAKAKALGRKAVLPQNGARQPKQPVRAQPQYRWQKGCRQTAPVDTEHNPHQAFSAISQTQVHSLAHSHQTSRVTAVSVKSGSTVFAFFSYSYICTLPILEERLKERKTDTQKENHHPVKP